MQTSGTQEKEAAPRRKSRYTKWLILLAGLGAAGGMLVTSAVIGAYYYVAPGLPPADTIRGTKSASGVKRLPVASSILLSLARSI